MSLNALDKTDRQILNLLQKNGRLSNQDLADKIALSPSPCLRRVKRLEEEGYIKGYAARVDADRIGRGLIAFVSIRLNKHSGSSHAPMQDFNRDVQLWPEVVECHSMSGDMDYLLRVQVQDLAAFSAFAMNVLMQHPSVVDMRSSFALGKIKESGALLV